MKIGILVTIISGFGKKGFYHSQEVGLGKAFNELGHEVIIYKCVTKDQKSDERQINDHLLIRYIPVPALGVHGYFNSGMLNPELDGLLVFADTQIFLPHVYRYCKKHQICFIPYIGIAHSAWNTLKSRVMDLLYAMGTRRIYGRIPVLVKTGAVAEEMKAQGVRDCTITPVGLDESELKTDYRREDRHALREKYGYSDEDVIISFVGRIKVEKRPLDLIDIFDEIKDKKQFKLLIVGEGYQEEAVAEKVRNRKLENYVRMIQRVPYENMWEIHYISDYFLNLCHREIFGMALLEAVYYGSSVAATEAPGPNSILKALPGHTLCKNDDEIKQWLLMRKPDQTVLDASAAELMRRFSWKNCAQASESLIRAYHNQRVAGKQVKA